MDLLFYNVSWMIFNAHLAVLPVFFLWLFFAVRHKLFKFIFAFLWLIYLPNSIYVFADLSHLLEQWPQVEGSQKVILVIQYAMLEFVGLLAFLYAMYPFEEFVKKNWIQSHNARTIFLVGFNFLLGFCMALGRVERVNSWDVFTATDKVILAGYKALFSTDLLLLSLIFGLFTNFFYFLLRKPVVKFFNKI